MTQDNEALVARSVSPLEERLKEQFLVGLSGDEITYGEFLKTSAKIVRSNLRKTIPGSSSYAKDLLEDLVQDVLLSIHQKRHTYRSEYPILPWLFAIARHRWIDIARMLSVRPKLLNWDETEWQEIPDNEAVERVERNESEAEAKNQVNELLEVLTPKQQELIRLAKLEELPLNEVAIRMGLSLSAVKVGVHRAMHKLASASGNSANREKA